MGSIAKAIGALAFVTATGAQTTAPQIRPRDAKQFVGQTVTVCGKVVDYACTTSRDVIMMNLDLPTMEEGLSVAVAAANWPMFPSNFPEEYLCASSRDCATVCLWG